MLSIIIFYLVVPFVLAAFVLKFLGKYAPHDIPEDIAQLYAAHPLEKRWFRAIRKDHKGVLLLGDYETQGEAVDRAYKGKEDAQAAAHHAAFLVLNDKGEVLEEVDS